MLLMVLGRIWPYVLGMALAMGAYAYVHHAGAVSQKAKDDKIIAKVTAEKDKAVADRAKYVSDQLAYAAQVRADQQAATDLANKLEKELADARANVATLLAERSKRLPNRTYILPPDYRGLLNDAAAASGPAPAPGSPKVAASPSQAATTLGDVADWGVAAAEVHRECVDQVTGWQRFYQGLRKTTPTT